jgi:alkylation response protein AidB-like acyl-CoA dehydrogenase
METLMMEEIGKECPALALILDVHFVCFHLMDHFGTEEQKAKYVPRLASGEWIGAVSGTEPQGNTNIPEWQPMGKKDGDDIILNCTKLFCTSSHVADIILVLGLIDGALQCVLVEKGMKGLETGHVEHKLGLAGSGTGTVRYNNIRIPKENICLIKPQMSIDAATMFLNMSAICLGLSESVFEKTKNYVLNRTRFGKPLAGNQVVAHHLAKMATQIELARSILHRAARLYDEGKPDVTLTFMNKAYVPEMAVHIANQCIQLYGGAGYMEDTGIAKYLRDAVAFQLAEYPTELHYDWIALHMGLPIETMFPVFPIG